MVIEIESSDLGEEEVDGESGEKLGVKVSYSDDVAAKWTIHKGMPVPG